MKTIRKYFDQVLRPFLKDHLDPAFENDVFNDIERRLVSIFKNWGTEKFRKTLFLPVIELASFYQPAHANLDARAIVVAGVRNGMIEDLHTPYPYNPMFAGTPRITQEGMRKITSWSSLFFQEEKSWQPLTNSTLPTRAIYFSVWRISIQRHGGVSKRWRCCDTQKDDRIFKPGMRDGCRRCLRVLTTTKDLRCTMKVATVPRSGNN